MLINEMITKMITNKNTQDDKGNGMKVDYQELTEEYLSYFQDEWSTLLKSMNCGQGQLLIGSRLRPQIVL